MGPAQQPAFKTITKCGNQLLLIEDFSDCLQEEERVPEFPHIHTYTEILWIMNGSGELHLDMQVVELEPGQMYFIRPGQVHKVYCDRNTSGYVLSLSKKLLENPATEMEPASVNEFVASVLEHKQIHIDPNYQADMQDILERMMRETASLREYSNEILRRYFNIFLFYLGKQLNGSATKISQSRNIQVCQQFKALVDKYYKTKKGVSEYASELNLTPNYLNEIIKKVTGHSAGYLIRQRIAMEAKRYAVHSTVCMKEIGYHLGFSDMAHFSKFFKSVVGSNFTDFKNNRAALASFQARA
jgi:AraC family transcriptional regulator, transcriptional activator of pobA